MSKTALVQLCPLELFFFGGETTHGNGAGSNYFAKSNMYPQQSTLCGILRHLLLSNGYSRGQHSFTPEDVTKNDYGDLIGLSPLFLKNSAGQFFLKQAIDRNPGKPAMTLETDEREAVVLQDNGEVTFPTIWQPARRWPGFIPKEKLSTDWVAQDGSSVKPEDIFKVFNRPGIPKQEIRKPEPNSPGLYKQDLVRLERGWTFCVLAKFKENVDLKKIDGQNFQVGGEKSIFHINVKEAAQTFDQMFTASEMFYRDNPPAEPRLVLASDAWVPESAWKYSIGAVTSTTDFRHIRTHHELKKFSRMRQSIPDDTKRDPTDQLAKSTKYTLLSRGSVFICSDKESLEKLADELRNQKPWFDIGFNHFITYCP